MIERLRRRLPDAEALRRNRWLRWLGPALLNPRLWHVSRRGVALGVALGLFFGLLIPVAQIPVSAAAAVALRANLPVAVASTLVTNPVTFGPVYYAAWRLGGAILGEPVADEPLLPPSHAPREPGLRGWIVDSWQRLLGVGRPLALGLAIIASAAGVAAYCTISLAWRLKTARARRMRIAQRAAAHAEGKR